MKSQNKETGRLGEDMAADFLVKKGYKILDRNYSTKFGELDIIALYSNSPAKGGATLVFVEVKTKTSDQFGSPEEMITPHKLRQIQNTAQSYILSVGAGLCACPLRIDAICINLETKTIKHYENITE